MKIKCSNCGGHLNREDIKLCPECFKNKTELAVTYSELTYNFCVFDIYDGVIYFSGGPLECEAIMRLYKQGLITLK